MDNTKKRLKIVYLMHGDRHVGGGERILLQTIISLDRNRFRPVVLYGRRNRIIDEFEKHGIETAKFNLGGNISAIDRNEINQRPFLIVINAYYLASAVFKLTRTLKGLRADIFHPHDNLSKLIGGISGRLAGVPVISHCHDFLDSSLIERIILFNQKFVMNRVIAVSESVRRLFGRQGKEGGKVSLIYNGLDLDRFRPGVSGLIREDLGIPDGASVISVIAMLEPIKGHRYFFEAIRKLKRESDLKFFCIVAGEGTLAGELARKVEESGIEDCVKFLDLSQDVPDLLSITDIAVMPSERESFGLAAAEAMAMKVPVIASGGSGMEEVILHGETGVIVPSRDPEAIFRALTDLIEHSGKRKKMGEAGRLRVEKMFNIRKNAKKIEYVYMDMAG
ncbi:glycosyltransferase family 4 protein [Fibrobacterota bacterium]